MGGTGSGSHYHWWRSGKKSVVEECMVIDAARWTREGILKAGVHRSGARTWIYSGGRECSIGYQVNTLDMDRPHVRLWYTRTTASGEQDSPDYCVLLTTTRPRFGGVRWWFLCPLFAPGRPCGGRVGKLYLPPGGRYFGCRKCYDLTYTSCQESRKYDRLYRYVAGNLGWDFANVKRVLNRFGKRR